jgi:uroporphyrinogen-III decarboxylase
MADTDLRKAPEELFQEREKRIRDAFQLKVPDRVPVVLGGTLFAARYAGLTFASAYYDAAGWKEAYKKTMLDMQPDAFGTAGGGDSGLALEALEPRQTLWPGGPLPANAPWQYIEGEFMKPDEYDQFLDDPTDFILRCYLPRVYGALEPLARLPAPRNVYAGIPAITPLFVQPEFRRMARALLKAGEAQAKWRQEIGQFDDEMAALGFPTVMQKGGAGGAPFETLSSRLRGMKGAMVDMYARPDKLLAASEKIQKWHLANAAPADPKKRGNPKMGSAGGVLRGADGFMPKVQFEKFYWPFQKKSIMKTIELGYAAFVFCEGRCDDRLEYFLEIPKGTMVIRFAETDMKRAKEVLGGHQCIQGAVPSSLLMTGSTQEVEEYCRNLIKICGKDGGYIMRATTDSIEFHNPANIKAMIDTCKKYGRY